MAIVNGIDLDLWQGAINAVKDDPGAGGKTVMVETKWLGGTMSESIVGQSGEFVVRSDEPTALGGGNAAPTPVQITLSALGSCLVIGLAANAALMGIEIENMRLAIEGKLDIRGFFGLSEEVRPGLQSIKCTIYLKSDAPKERLEALRKHVKKTSPCVDICSNQIGAMSSELVFE
ncbi:OsmC-like protein [bacterium BMS3Bbin06]|nr:OsmC-like protein [bacterium BMS3Abin08]GBE35213.1 OsmC-like protein [bacterium BMS3Bbin06]HDO36041.1 OsmC family peroxiredoxin [Nitrospirota bacterium]HDY70653.1 OsmC family peroxiredoxin [Nitrospirota bacterium]